MKARAGRGGVGWGGAGLGYRGIYIFLVVLGKCVCVSVCVCVCLRARLHSYTSQFPRVSGHVLKVVFNLFKIEVQKARDVENRACRVFRDGRD